MLGRIRRARCGARLCVLGLAAVATGCGSESVYSTDFDLSEPLESRPHEVRRDVRYLDVWVNDGSCEPGKDDPARRFDRATVRERPGAVLITVWMREDTHRCASLGVGRSFKRRIGLPRPLGRRAVVDDSDGYHVVVVPPTDPRLRKLLKRYEPPED